MIIDEELAKKVFKEEQARFNAEQEAKFKAEQEQEKFDFEIALKLQRRLDEREEVVAKEAHDIDWSDPSVLRYHALHNRPFSVADVMKNMLDLYLKEYGIKIRLLYPWILKRKKKLEDDAEKEELQVYLNIVLEEESLNVESLATKYLIVD
ncbi:hypothetical protein Tco_0874149 [Tanacetum coccineum]|uniref:Uncharacterized protein n=1 Tax=Tanacetum coccineum TaxID=301880 RepID=A0ABQ5BLJ2_9ASTR